MKGYYKLPDLTKETIKDGWLHTGDQGVIDKDGYLFVTGRVKDLFKTTKGKYIEPLVLESHFTDISDFEQICVVGLGLDQPICLGVLSEIGKEKTKEEIKNFMQQHGGTSHHPDGTCKMGEDTAAVVDSRLRVHGIEGLRVADASIMPTLTTGNTNAPTIMIGEKCAAMMLEDAQ